MAGSTKKSGSDKPEERKASGKSEASHAQPARAQPPKAQAQHRELEEEDFDEAETLEEESGTSDPEFDLVSVLYHALQGAEMYAEFVDDAEDANDRELAEFFVEVQREEEMRAERAKQLLASRFARSAARSPAGWSAAAAREAGESQHP